MTHRADWNYCVDCSGGSWEGWWLPEKVVVHLSLFTMNSGIPSSPYKICNSLLFFRRINLKLHSGAAVQLSCNAI